jgi:hypothetical protein
MKDGGIWGGLPKVTLPLRISTPHLLVSPDTKAFQTSAHCFLATLHHFSYRKSPTTRAMSASLGDQKHLVKPFMCCTRSISKMQTPMRVSIDCRIKCNASIDLRIILGASFAPVNAQVNKLRLTTPLEICATASTYKSFPLKATTLLKANWIHKFMLTHENHQTARR